MNDHSQDPCLFITLTSKHLLFNSVKGGLSNGTSTYHKDTLTDHAEGSKHDGACKQWPELQVQQETGALAAQQLTLEQALQTGTTVLQKARINLLKLAYFQGTLGRPMTE